MGTLINQIGIPDIPITGIEQFSVSRVQSIVENPRKVIPVNDPKNQSFVGTQTHSLPIHFCRETMDTPVVVIPIFIKGTISLGQQRKAMNSILPNWSGRNSKKLC
jgi:hypothetical protein